MQTGTLDKVTYGAKHATFGLCAHDSDRLNAKSPRVSSAVPPGGVFGMFV
jgi:hypothetical protein